MIRAALWLLALFAAAVGAALFATRSTGTITVFWPPHRVDLSLNLSVLILAALFALFYAAIRAIAALAALPAQAKAWRQAQRQQAMNALLRDALAHLLAGRFSRAKRQALQANQLAKSLAAEPKHKSASAEVQALALLIAAESAQCMQDVAERERWVQAARELDLPGAALHFREGLALRSARWPLDEADPATTLLRLSTLSQGAQRRTLALRLKLRALQMSRQQMPALETARLLAKHGGFSASAGQSIVRSLAISALTQAHDADQLTQTWRALHEAERTMPEVATHAALRLVNLGAGLPEAQELCERACAWIEPVWRSYPQLGESAQLRLVQALEASLLTQQGAGVDQRWLASIEAAQRQLPHDARLQYLAGMACFQRQLWGKAQQLLSVAATSLADENLRRNAWRCLGMLAEQRDDSEAALAAWKQAAA